MRSSFLADTKSVGIVHVPPPAPSSLLMFDVAKEDWAAFLSVRILLRSARTLEARCLTIGQSGSLGSKPLHTMYLSPLAGRLQRIDRRGTNEGAMV